MDGGDGRVNSHGIGLSCGRDSHAHRARYVCAHVCGHGAAELVLLLSMGLGVGVARLGGGPRLSSAGGGRTTRALLSPAIETFCSGVICLASVSLESRLASPPASGGRRPPALVASHGSELVRPGCSTGIIVVALQSRVEIHGV